MTLLISADASETGGLSGPPLFAHALTALRSLRPLLPPSIPIIACGGITTPSDALTMAQSGASLVQIYTSFGYQGVGTPRLLKDGISTELLPRHTRWKDQVRIPEFNERLAEESRTIRKQAEDLAAMLRDLDLSDDTERLAREAQETLRGVSESVNDAAAQSDDTPGSRDNSLGAGQVRGMLEPAHEVQDEQAQGQMEGPTVIEGMVGPAPIGQAVDLAPVVVIEPGRPDDEHDDFADQARNGPRRLV